MLGRLFESGIGHFFGRVNGELGGECQVSSRIVDVGPRSTDISVMFFANF
jgi:hypothetical protein